MKRLFVFLMVSLAMCFCCGSIAYAAQYESDAIYDDTARGEMVVRIQMRLRELGYLNFKPTGSYKSMTVSAAKAFQANYRDNGYDIMVDGKMGPQSLEYLFKHEAFRSSLSGVSIPSGPKRQAESLFATGSLTDWSLVKDTLVVGQTYSMTDCYTGQEFDMTFTGGSNHAEMEPASADDAVKFKYICGEDYNYLKRAIVININDKYIAASIQCYPHGTDGVSENGVEGHVCVFFSGSLSHVGMLTDVEHIENIHIASGS